MFKPKVCLKCGSGKVLRIFYGLPADDYTPKKDEYLGGCCDEGYKWHCGDCAWEWGDGAEGQHNGDDTDSVNN